MFRNWWQFPFSWGRHLKGRICERPWTFKDFHNCSLHQHLKGCQWPWAFLVNDVVRQRGPCREVVGAQVREHKRGVPMRLPSVMPGRNSPRDTHGRNGEGLLTFTDDPDLGLEHSEDCCMKTSISSMCCGIQDGLGSWRRVWEAGQRAACGSQTHIASMPSSTSQAPNCHQEGKRIWSYSLDRLRSLIPNALCFSRKGRSLWRQGMNCNIPTPLPTWLCG